MIKLIDNMENTQKPEDAMLSQAKSDIITDCYFRALNRE